LTPYREPAPRAPSLRVRRQLPLLTRLELMALLVGYGGFLMTAAGLLSTVAFLCVDVGSAFILATCVIHSIGRRARWTR
jgi:hypothetical protein